MMTKTSGFTLTETLVAMVIGLISIVAAFSAYNYYNKSYASVSQKVTVNKSAREALSLITTDLRNTGYYHVDFESANCSKLNNADIDLIGITHGDTRNQRAGKHKQADALHLYYSISAKDQKRVKYELKKYQNSDDYYLMRDVVINPIGHDPSRGCPQWTRTYNMVADEELLIPYVEDFQVIPKDNQKKLEIELKPFLNSVDRVASVSLDKKDGVKFNLKKNMLDMSVNNTNSGDGKESLSVKFDHELDISFNSRYLIDVASQLDGDQIEIYLKDTGSPALIRDPADFDSIYVVMPMKG